AALRISGGGDPRQAFQLAGPGGTQRRGFGFAGKPAYGKARSLFRNGAQAEGRGPGRGLGELFADSRRGRNSGGSGGDHAGHFGAKAGGGAVAERASAFRRGDRPFADVHLRQGLGREV